jgi:16S rRNA G966 N2-methylase RsmD
MTKAEIMLTQATTIQKAKELKDLALTAKQWATQKGLGKKIVKDCQIYAQRANTRLGELLIAGKKANQIASPGKPKSLNVTHDDIYKPAELKELGITRNESANAQKIATAPAKIKERVESGEITISAALKEVRRIDKDKEAAELAKAFDGRFDIEDVMRLGDFYRLSEEIEDESVDHIITDPPYPEEFLDLWSQLSEVAARVLRPGGFCITYSGKMHLPEVIKRLSEHLSYYWQMILVHTGPPAGVHPVKVNTGYKPILVFYKPPINPQSEYISDIIMGTGREKDDHEWQQAEGEIKIILERLTKPNDLILDPFAGSGTTIIGCLKNKRRCIGMEKDEETREKAKIRIKANLS